MKLSTKRILSGLMAVFLSTPVFATSAPTYLIIKPYTITVNGKKASVFRIAEPDGTWGYVGEKGQYFNVIVKNETTVPTVLHWHGLIVPNNQDGVPYITQPPIPAGGEYHYYFKILQSGTYWLHAHYGLQVQQIMSAPLILLNPDNHSKAKSVIMFLNDFSFRSPQAILYDLQHQKMSGKKSDKPDLTDVTYDAFLTNYRTLQSPEIVRVTPGEQVRLRIIDAAAMSAFFVNTGSLKGTLIAADGKRIHPISNTTYELASGQRLDVLVTIPPGQGAYPILAQGEGTNMQTGLILATASAKIPTLSETADTTAGALSYNQEWQLKAMHPLPIKTPQIILHAILTGSMMPYQWKINDQMWPKITPFVVKKGDRVEIIFDNQTNMAHPMHLHGTDFEVTAINGKPVVDGAMRDTVLVMPHTTLAIQFDATNPGNWLLHCHMTYHQAAGMMTLLTYQGIKVPPLKME